MRPPVRPALLAAVALSGALSGCGLPQKYDAAEDVHAFFVAVQDNDRAAFERYVDRPALRESMKSQLGRAAGGDVGDLLGSLLSGSAGDRAVDALISPEAFRIAWQHSGVSTAAPPDRMKLTYLLRRVSDDRVCLPSGRRCVMTFADEAGTWKLVAIDAGKLKIG